MSYDDWEEAYGNICVDAHCVVCDRKSCDGIFNPNLCKFETHEENVKGGIQ